MSYLLASSGMFYVWDVYHESGIIISTDLSLLRGSEETINISDLSKASGNLKIRINNFY